jgi:hypothetical protein
MDGDHSENYLTDKLDLQTKRRLLRRILDAYKILENEHVSS